MNGSQWSLRVNLSNGLNSIEVVARDSRNNETRDTLSVSYDPAAVDTVLDYLSITSPSNNTVIGYASVTVTVTANDGAGIDSVLVNGVKAVAIGGNQWQASAALAQQGNNPVLARAFDKKGNQDSTSINVIYNPVAVDNIRPSITPYAPLPNDIVASASQWIAVTVSDASGISSVTINGGAAASNSGRYERNVTLNVGANTITVIAVDNSAQQNRGTAIYTLTYDSTKLDSIPPLITLVSHTSGQTVTAASQLVQVTASDANKIFSVTINGFAAAYNALQQRYERTLTLALGVDTITVVAVDSSTRRNTVTGKYTLTYNPVVNPVTLYMPYTVTVSGMSLRWSRSSAVGFSAYRVYHSETSTVDTNSTRDTIITNVNDTDHVLHGLQENKRYRIMVYVFGQGGYAGSNMVDTVTANLAPATVVMSIPPANITASSIRLTWTTLSGTPDFAAYKIYRSFTGGVTTGSTVCTTITDRTNLAATISGLAEDTRYHFKVFVSDGLIDAGSNEDSASTFNVPPVAVTLYTPTQATDSSMVIGWSQSAISDFTAYRVFYSTAPNVTNNGTPDTVILDRAVTSTKITGLRENTTYYIKVFVYDKSSNTGSGEVNGATANLPPPAVTLLSAAVTAPNIALTWTKSAALDFAGYRVFCRTTDSLVTTTDSQVVFRNAPQINDTTVTLTGLAGSRTYYFRVFVYDNSLNTGSNVKSAYLTGWQPVGSADGILAGMFGVSPSWLSMVMATNAGITTPYLAYSDETQSGKAVALRYDSGANSWQAVDNTGTQGVVSSARASYITLKDLNSAGQGLCISYIDAGQFDRATAKQFFFGNIVWNDIAGGRFSSSFVQWPAISFSASAGTDGFIGLYLNGATFPGAIQCATSILGQPWRDTTGISFTSQGSMASYLSMLPTATNGNIYVSFLTDQYTAIVAQRDPFFNWHTIAVSMTPISAISEIQATASAGGAPYLVALDVANSVNNVIVGSPSWQQRQGTLDGTLSMVVDPPQGTGSPAFDFFCDGTNGYLAYADGGMGGKLTVARCDASNDVGWSSAVYTVIGSRGFSAGKVKAVTLAVMNPGSVPYVAYVDEMQPEYIKIVKY